MQIQALGVSNLSVDNPAKYWQDKAAARAGLKLDGWDPQKGFAQTKPYVWGVYNYYKNLQLKNPQLLWAGMAYGIGPSFAAGMQDVAAFNGYVQQLQDKISSLPAPVADAARGVLNLIGSSGIKVARDLETRLLGMQKKIFLDQGMQHEAYLGGGLKAVQELYRAGAIDFHALQAWKDIDLGKRGGKASPTDTPRALIEGGNKELLRREQWQIIADDYDQMRALTRLSPVATYLLTMVGKPSIPGAKSAKDSLPVKVGPFKFPAARIDITRADDRWKLIERDTWPAFTSLVNAKPAEYKKMLNTSLDQRISEGHLRYLPDSASTLDVVRYLAAVASGRGL